MNEFLLESQDVNGDGIIEFSISVHPKGWEEHSHAEATLFEQYVQWKGNAEFQPIDEKHVNIEQGYFITIPKKLVKEITIQEGSKNTQHLRYTDTDEKWLEVHTFDTRVWPKMKNYEVVVKTNFYVLCSAKIIKIPKA
ncbi:hypothetical protein P4256_27660 [Bacillus wiedmannii]|uniref:hypothetical protein n=2 Tax=Bacillus cereus group TaxID=86661 RepID=UPI002E2102AF|nr:hypothetical protein [Bacillus wiedmannii]